MSTYLAALPLTLIPPLVISLARRKVDLIPWFYPSALFRIVDDTWIGRPEFPFELALGELDNDLRGGFFEPFLSKLRSVTLWKVTLSDSRPDRFATSRRISVARTAGIGWLSSSRPHTDYQRRDLRF